MRKRIIPVMLAMLLSVLPCNSMAKTAVFGNISDDGTVKLSLSSDVGASNYGVHILKPGYTIDDVNQITAGTSGAFAGFETMSLADGGENEFSNTQITFKLADGAAEGVYTLVIGGGELEGREITVAHSSGYSQAASEAKAAQDLDSVLNQYQNLAWSLDFTNSSYVSHKDMVIENMKEILADSAATSEAVVTAFNQACILAELKACTADEIAENLLMYEEYLGLDYAETVNADPEKLETAFLSLRADEESKTPEELATLVRASKALMLLNDAGRDEVISVLKEYNDIFKLDFIGDYTTLDPYDVAKKVAADGIPYTKLADIRERFNNAIEELAGTDDDDDGYTPPSGGGGGGGGGGSSYTAPPAKEESTVDTEKIAQQDTKELFNDLDSAEWAIPYIKYLSENEIMQGDGKGNFRPNDGILREEFLALIIRAFGIEHISGKTAAFTDVEADAWYKDYVVTGTEHGLVNGVSNEKFGIGEYISREDAAVMLKRALEACNISLTEKSEEIVFTDGNDISDYAAEAVSVLSKAQIINGYETGEFAPKRHILRCEAAKIIYSAIKAMER